MNLMLTIQAGTEYTVNGKASKAFAFSIHGPMDSIVEQDHVITAKLGGDTYVIHNPEQGAKFAFGYKVTEDNTWYDVRTDDAVIAELQQARRYGYRLRLRTGDPETGLDWLDEWDSEGTIGRSTGSVKTPLLIKKRTSHGGGAILTHCVLRILNTTDPYAVRYSHPLYHHPVFTTGPAESEGYLEAVYADGKLYAQFKKPGQAAAWIFKMSR